MKIHQNPSSGKLLTALAVAMVMPVSVTAGERLEVPDPSIMLPAMTITQQIGLGRITHSLRLVGWNQ